MTKWGRGLRGGMNGGEEDARDVGQPIHIFVDG